MQKTSPTNILPASTRRDRLVLLGSCLLLLALALGLRLVVWRWREPYPLGGDEQEYFNQALTLLREKQYVELRLMRPPLYTAFLAGSIYLFDSPIQRLRLVQEIIGALTVAPVYALVYQLFRSRRAAFIAGLLFALNYTLAAAATELLTETVFLFGLTLVMWLLVRAASAGTLRQRVFLAVLAGLGLGMLALVRSVALPLVPLGALWLLAAQHANVQGRNLLSRLRLPAILVISAFIIILPWTARNYLTYGSPILIDTTGAENLWLDNNPSAAKPNDPLGREAAKAELYALGDDRGARQRLATQRGVAEIVSHPTWFIGKTWEQAKLFFALHYFDELREKRAIWVPPAEVWAKLALGDGLWLVLLFGGIIGIWLQPSRSNEIGYGRIRFLADARWLLVPWALYILLTSMIFHVELRYRLPVYPVLAAYTSLALTRATSFRRTWSFVGAGATVAMCAAISLLHRPYLGESWMLANKHVALRQAEQALAKGDAAQAKAASSAALAWDESSALARVAQARATILQGDLVAADQALNSAIAVLDAHPQAHLLRGALLRRNGMFEQAHAELAHETGSLQDLQAWSWEAFAPLGPPPDLLNIGAGLDLGYVRGFYPAENGYRWTEREGRIQLTAPEHATAVELEVAPGRPQAAPVPTLVVYNGAMEMGRVILRGGWQTITLPIPAETRHVELVLRADTFRPRAFDRASQDNRELGVMVRRAAVIK